MALGFYSKENNPAKVHNFVKPINLCRSGGEPLVDGYKGDGFRRLISHHQHLHLQHLQHLYLTFSITQIHFQLSSFKFNLQNAIHHRNHLPLRRRRPFPRRRRAPSPRSKCSLYFSSLPCANYELDM